MKKLIVLLFVMVGLMVSGCEESKDIEAILGLVKDEVIVGFSDGLEVTENLVFPVTSTDYATADIVWTSSNTDVIAEDGTVTPTLYDSNVTITVTITYLGREVTESFDVIVLGTFDAEDHLAWLDTFEKPDLVDGVITLPSTENIFGYDASFSVDQGLVIIEGVITLPASALEDGLTFTLTLTSHDEEITFDYVVMPPNQLNAVENIRYENNQILWDGVDGADVYHVTIYKAELVVVDEDADETSIAFVDQAGYYDVYITAKDSSEVMNDSGEAMTTISVLSEAETIIIEAEDGALNDGMYKGNELASGGAYVGGIDNVGQGIMLMVLVPAEGDYLLDVFYSTGFPPSAHEVFINGVSQGKVTYTTNTGWGGEGYYVSDFSQIVVSLDSGYNEIVIQKTNESDNWTELDKVVLTPNGSLFYNVDDLDDVEIPVYTLQAEWANMIGGNIGIRVNEVASNGAYVGGIDNVGDGIKFRFFAVETGTYTMTIKYTTGVDNPQHEVFVGETSYGKVIYTQNTGWGGIGFYPNAAITIQIDLVEGENSISILKTGETDQWVELDMVMLELDLTE